MSKLVYLWESILLLMQELEDGTKTLGRKPRRRTATTGNYSYSAYTAGGGQPGGCRQPNLPKLRHG
jgi:hypothetical protein